MNLTNFKIRQIHHCIGSIHAWPRRRNFCFCFHCLFFFFSIRPREALVTGFFHARLDPHYHFLDTPAHSEALGPLLKPIT